MDLSERIDRQFQDSVQAKLQSLDSLGPTIGVAIERMTQALVAEKKIMACGNGGSAADSQHFAAELVNRFEQERPPLAALALTTDTSVLTSIGNDYDYSLVFAKQVQALGRTGDLLIAISTSGNSPNVVAAVHAAHDLEIDVIALTGRGGGELGTILGERDLHLCVPSTSTARIQEVHALILHCFCDGIDSLLLGNDA